MNKPQNELIFALDIGTRSVIGIVGETRGEMFHVLYMEKEEHSRRAMVDGQIEDIDQVALIVTRVKERLEEQVGHPLTRVCVAAAGRSLRMERARALVELPEVHTITDDLISQLEALAIAEAEQKLSDHNKDQRFYLVGYTVVQYVLDRYPMTTIKGHNGQVLEADVVATFLPSQVVEGLYTVVKLAGMEVASLTLEPIAALNATIPPDLRLLNLVLVDIGAGTSDIAVCRDGSVVGYTMATTAGDEITEMLMKHFLVDFRTGEMMKTSMGVGDLKYTDVLGLEQTTTGQQISEALDGASKTLVKEIAKQILAINGCAPSAVFMAGGGSKLDGITGQLAGILEMQPHRIAVAGSNYNRTIVSETYELEDPEYATPLGIAVSAALGLINDSYHITLNGKAAKLFRSGSLSLLDILMMNGFTAAALIGRTGKNLAIMINGNKKIIRGKPSIPGILRLNGEPAVAGAVVSAGDVIEFVPAIDGLSATTTLQELLGDYAGRVLLNGQEAPWDTQLRNGDAITTISTGNEPPPRIGTNPLSAEEVSPVDVHGNPLPASAVEEAGNSLRNMERPEDFTYLTEGGILGQLSRPISNQITSEKASPLQTPPTQPMAEPEANIALPSLAQQEDEDVKIYANEPAVAEVTPLQPEQAFPDAPQVTQATQSPVPEVTQLPETPPVVAEVPRPEIYEPAEPLTTPDIPVAEPEDFRQNTMPLEPITPEALEAHALETAETAAEAPAPAPVPQPQPVPEPVQPAPEPVPMDMTHPVAPVPQPPAPAPAPAPAPQPPSSVGAPTESQKPSLKQGAITLNGKQLELPPKADGSPYYLMDLLDKTEIDFRRVSKPILMLVNGEEGFFVQHLHANDNVIIQEQN